MSDPDSLPRHSADIIAFPTAPRAPAPQGEDGAERLRRALVALDVALQGQRGAVAGWRSAIADLRDSMGSLGSSVQRYRSALDVLGGRVETLGDTARRLRAQADALETAAKG
jgi:hypothetical protein